MPEKMPSLDELKLEIALLEIEIESLTKKTNLIREHIARIQSR